MAEQAMDVTRQQVTEFERPDWMRHELGAPTGRGIRIALIDSGCDARWRHLSIRRGIGLVDPERQFALRRSADDDDRNGHGTACADILLRLAPEVEIYPVRIFDQRLETSLELFVKALEWAVEERMHLVNLSLGTVIESHLRPLYRVCELARRRGLVIVAAANLALGWSYPAIFENVIGVRPGRFRNPFEFEYQADEAVECIAEGEHAVRWLGGEARTVFGSSFAAPCIAGLVALFLERFPKADLSKIRELLRRYASDLARIDGGVLQR